MVAHGGISPFTFEILQDQAGVQTPSQTRVSLGQADPHENSGVWKQMQRTAVEIGVQAIEILVITVFLQKTRFTRIRVFCDAFFCVCKSQTQKTRKNAFFV